MTLREQMLREALSERQRGLKEASALCPQLRPCLALSRCDRCDMGIQTDPVTILGSESSVAALPAAVPLWTAVSASFPAPAAVWASVDDEAAQAEAMAMLRRLGTPRAAPAPVWTGKDDNAQAEALAMLKLMGERTSQSQQAEDRVAMLEQELRAERTARRTLAAQLSAEQGKKDAAQQQVLCLEYELDGKEAALAVAEMALEKRDSELQQTHVQLRQAHDRIPVRRSVAQCSQPPDETRFRAQLLDRERQLELKEQHLARLAGVLRPTLMRDDDATTVCGSERSYATGLTGFTGFTGYS